MAHRDKRLAPAPLWRAWLEYNSIEFPIGVFESEYGALKFGLLREFECNMTLREPSKEYMQLAIIENKDLKEWADEAEDAREESFGPSSLFLLPTCYRLRWKKVELPGIEEDRAIKACKILRESILQALADGAKIERGLVAFDDAPKCKRCTPGEDESSKEAAPAPGE